MGRVGWTHPGPAVPSPGDGSCSRTDIAGQGKHGRGRQPRGRTPSWDTCSANTSRALLDHEDVAPGARYAQSA